MNYQILLTILTVIILGEGINAFTAWVTKISPVKMPKTQWFKTFFKQGPVHIWLQDTPWPIWVNVASFPVSFAVFDRYYLSTLDQDRKILAGKIGWTAFYRNCGFVFVIISIIQIPYFIGTITTLMPKFECLKAYLMPSFSRQSPYRDTCKEMNTNLLLFLVIPIGMNILPYLVPMILVPAFIIAYLAQVNSNKNIFWRAFRRNELRKILDAKHGDLTLALGIKSSFMKRAMDFITDRWFLAADYALKDLSIFFLTKAEKSYHENAPKIKDHRTTFLITNALKNLEIRKFFKYFFNWSSCNKIYLNEIKKTMTETYQELDVGNYDIVLSHSILIMEKLYSYLQVCNPLSDENYWKNIKGHYMIGFALHTQVAFEEIKTKMYQWGWTYQNHKSDESTNVKSDKTITTNIKTKGEVMHDLLKNQDHREV